MQKTAVVFLGKGKMKFPMTLSFKKTVFCSLWVFKLWTESENKNIISLATLLSPWCHTNQLSPVVICCSSQDGICETLLYTWHNQLYSSSSSPQEWHIWLCLTAECWPRALQRVAALSGDLEKVRVGKRQQEGRNLGIGVGKGDTDRGIALGMSQYWVRLSAFFLLSTAHLWCEKLGGGALICVE